MAAVRRLHRCRDETTSGTRAAASSRGPAFDALASRPSAGPNGGGAWLDIVQIPGFLSRRSSQSIAAGMLWLYRKTFAGSYACFNSASLVFLTICRGNARIPLIAKNVHVSCVIRLSGAGVIYPARPCGVAVTARRVWPACDDIEHVRRLCGDRRALLAAMST